MPQVCAKHVLDEGKMGRKFVQKHLASSSPAQILVSRSVCSTHGGTHAGTYDEKFCAWAKMAKEKKNTVDNGGKRIFFAFISLKLL